MRALIFAVLLLPSCQSHFLSRWFADWKDYSLTQMASHATSGSLSEENRQELLFLFGDLSKAGNCGEIQSHIENNKALQFFEEELKLPKGFLFDELSDYSYESSLLQINKTVAQQAAFSIVSVWKTAVSLEEIRIVVYKVDKCYPSDYVEFI